MSLSDESSEDGSQAGPSLNVPFAAPPPADFFRMWHQVKFYDTIINANQEYDRAMRFMNSGFRFGTDAAKLMDEDPGSDEGGDRARDLFVQEHCKDIESRTSIEDGEEKTNLFGPTDVFFNRFDNEGAQAIESPILSDTRLVFTQKFKCSRESSCERREEKGGPRPDYQDEEEKVLCKLIPLFNVESMNEEGIKDYLDDHLEERTKGSRCDTMYIQDPTKAPGKEMPVNVCNGLEVISRAEVTQWPHLLILDHGEACLNELFRDRVTTKIDQIPFDFFYEAQQRRLVLRAVILGDGIHFTCIVRLPHCWLSYDGMRKHRVEGSTKLKTHKLTAQKARRAMEERGIAVIIFEAVEVGAPTFGDADFDIDTILAYEGCKNTPDNSTNGNGGDDDDDDDDDDDKNEKKDDDHKSEKKDEEEDKNDKVDIEESLTKLSQELKKKSQEGKKKRKSKKTPGGGKKRKSSVGSKKSSPGDEHGSG